MNAKFKISVKGNYGRSCFLFFLIISCVFVFSKVSVQAVDVKKGDTVTDGTFTYIILTSAGKKKDGTAAVYGLNKKVFNDKDNNHSPSTLEIPSRIKYNNGYYNITATGSSGKATLSGSSSTYQYYWGNVKKIILPETITVIGDNSFAKAEKLKEITIPESVTAIGGEAFADTSLTKITIPSTIKYLGRAAFWKCEKLKKVTFEEGLESIGKWAFQESGLKQAVLPEGLITIKQAAFSKCLSLKNVTIPASVAKIGSGVFSGCDSLKKVKVSEENITYQSIHEVIYSKDGKILVDGGAASLSYEAEEGTEVIEKCAFESNKKLTGIQLSDSVKTVKEGAFLNCIKLKKVEIGKNVTTLGASSFGKCSLLKKIEIPNKVKKIEKNAFYRCTSMETLSLGEHVSFIGEKAFSECQSLDIVAIPEMVSEIGKEAFYKNSSMTKLEISEGVVGIGKRAFSNCDLQFISLPESLQFIEEAAFQGNKKLTGVKIPAAVTKIADNVFASCEKLVNLEVSEENEIYCASNGALMNKTKTTLIAWPSAEGDISISDSITVIGSFALQDTQIDSVIIPDSVLKIESGAFAGCEELLWVKIEGNQILLPAKTEDEDKNSSAIFYGCFALQTVSVPEIDKEDQIQKVFSKRLKKHMDKNGTIAWLKE